MHIRPILSTLGRHRTAAALIILEIALTCAIVCNAIFLIRDRLSRMDTPSGVVEDELVVVRVTGIGTSTDAKAVTAQDLAALRALPGVKSVAVTNMVPFGRSSWNSTTSTIPDDATSDINSATYLGSADLVKTLGLRMTEGRDFTPSELVDFAEFRAGKVAPGTILLSSGLAARLYPGKSALGQKVYIWGKEPQIVVGVFEAIARPNNITGNPYADCAAVLPIDVAFNLGGYYVIRVDPARKGEVLAAADATLDKADPNRIVLEQQPFDQLRRNFFRQDRAMAYLLVGVSLGLLVITALGIVGLASFWVQQRTRQIGIRRALGATRGDILRYFQTENFILATAGIVLGMGLAYGLNLFLMSKYQVARLPAEFLPIGALLLWLLGQAAVLGPALRASLIPPATATRSV